MEHYQTGYNIYLLTIVTSLEIIITIHSFIKKVEQRLKNLLKLHRKVSRN